MPYGPVDGLHSPRFSGIATFARCPHVRPEDGVGLAVVGLPFDTATSYRTGQRFGPRAIREASALLRPWHAGLGVDVFAQSVVDWGDVDITPGNAERSVEQIAEGLAEPIARGMTPLALGGDHTVLLGELRAYANAFGPVGVIILDAHVDAWDSYYGERTFHGTIVRRAVEEGAVDPERSIIAGVRGPLYSAADERFPRELGFTVLGSEELRALAPAEFGRLAREKLAGGPAFLSFDIDVLDPAYAPGTGVPEIGGLATHEVLPIVRSLVGIDFCGFDVVEVLPASDTAGATTALNAAGIAWELMALSAVARAHRLGSTVTSQPTRLGEGVR